MNVNIPRTIIICVIGLITFYVYSYISQGVRDQRQRIDAIVQYSMPGAILERCKKDHNYTEEDMVILEKELKRFFALSSLKKDGVGIGMYSKDVDNLWHTFILFTREYADFCKKYMDHFVHHVPEIDKNLAPEKLVQARQDFQIFIKNYENTFHEKIHAVWLLDMCENDT